MSDFRCIHRLAEGFDSGKEAMGTMSNGNHQLEILCDKRHRIQSLKTPKHVINSISQLLLRPGPNGTIGQ